MYCATEGVEWMQVFVLEEEYIHILIERNLVDVLSLLASIE